MGAILNRGPKVYEFPKDLPLDSTRWYFQHFYPHDKCGHLDHTFHEGHEGATSMYFRKHPSYVIGAARFNRLQGTVFRDVTFFKEKQVEIFQLKKYDSFTTRPYYFSHAEVNEVGHTLILGTDHPECFQV